MNLERAKKIRDEMEHYIQLVENYKVDSFETAVIYHYGVYGSIPKTVEKLNETGIRIGERQVENDDVSKVIRSKKTMDELLGIVRKYYRGKITTKKMYGGIYR